MNPDWFEWRDYGWRLYPCTWQGWLSLALFIVPFALIQSFVHDRLLQVVSAAILFVWAFLDTIRTTLLKGHAFDYWDAGLLAMAFLAVTLFFFAFTGRGIDWYLFLLLVAGFGIKWLYNVMKGL